MISLTEAIRPTTLIDSERLRTHLGLDITVATETFQHTGSFKFRAAYNLVLNVSNDEIIAASSGNFGQALAYACKLSGKKCTIVMPATSATVKIDGVRSYGASVDLIDIASSSRGQRIAELKRLKPDAYVASAYDDKFVIEGNASLGDELSGGGYDVVIVPVGGGGLISGVINGLKRSGSSAEVYGAEPLLGNDGAESLRTGRLIRNPSEPATIADGARTLSLGDLNWEIIRKDASGIIEIPEDAIETAVRLHYSLSNLKCEPTGALSLGSLIVDKDRFAGKKICLVVSGGNVDPAVYAGIIGT